MSTHNAQWVPVCQVEDIPMLGARIVTNGAAGPIAVFRTDGDEVFAVLDKCPHKGGPLSQGIVLGKSVACPLHNWNIGLVDGCAAAPDEGCAKTYAIQVKDGQVFLNADEMQSAHVAEPA